MGKFYEETIGSLTRGDVVLTEGGPMVFSRATASHGGAHILTGQNPDSGKQMNAWVEDSCVTCVRS